MYSNVVLFFHGCSYDKDSKLIKIHAICENCSHMFSHVMTTLDLLNYITIYDLQPIEYNKVEFSDILRTIKHMKASHLCPNCNK